MTTMQITTISDAEGRIITKKGELVALANSLEIETDQNLSDAIDLARALKAQADIAEEEREKLVKPLNGVVKEVNARFKTITEPLNKARDVVKGKILQFQQYQEALKREQEEAARRKAAEEAQKQAQQAPEAESPTLSSQNSEAPQPRDPGPVERSVAAPDHHVLQPDNLIITGPKSESVRMRSDGGGLATVKKVWKYRVTDILELARLHPEAVQPNDEAIKHCIKSGVRSMPGLEIYLEDQLQVR